MESLTKVKKMYDTTKLNDFISKQKCTLLGIGPMSKNCVDVTIDLANQHDVPLMLIASRRQIESKDLGGGYVNNWTTEEFSEYVQKKDTKNNIILCRDHGGPFQGNNEKEQLSIKDALENAKKSYLTDIKSDFKILHIDPSETLGKQISTNDMLKIIYELYEFCFLAAQENKKQISFEISIDKEDGGVHKIDEIDNVISKIEYFCIEKKLPMPMFIVTKTGNHVMETKNIGIFEEIIKGKKSDDSKSIKKIIELCNKKCIMSKVHNADYLSNELLKIYPDIGVHAINVAPEFGVIETKSILSWFSKNNLQKEKKLFNEIALKSNKWKKWMIPNSNATKEDRSIISGHYVFSAHEFKTMMNNLENQKELNVYLKKEIQNSIIRYMRCLNLI